MVKQRTGEEEEKNRPFILLMSICSKMKENVSYVSSKI